MGEKLSQAQIEDQIERIKEAFELWKAREWLEVKRLKNEIKNKSIKDLLDALKDRHPAQIAAVFADDPQKFQAYIDYAKQQEQQAHEMEMFKIQSGMTPDQILAAGAAKDPNAAMEAYARGKEAAEGANAKVLEERRKMDAEVRADREKTEGRVIGLAEKAVERPTTVVQPPAPVTNMQH